MFKLCVSPSKLLRVDNGLIRCETWHGLTTKSQLMFAFHKLNQKRPLPRYNPKDTRLTAMPQRCYSHAIPLSWQRIYRMLVLEIELKVKGQKRLMLFKWSLWIKSCTRGLRGDYIKGSSEIWTLTKCFKVTRCILLSRKSRREANIKK